MSNAKGKTGVVEVKEPPKIPTLNFGKRPSLFSGRKGATPKAQFVPPTIRITQNKGGGGK